MTLTAWRKAYIERLSGLYPAGEAESLFFRAAEHALGIDRLRYTLERDNELAVADSDRLERVCRLLAQGRPFQYITGEQDFFSRRFRVDPRVLIPRGETEELVAMVLAENGPEPFRVLDVGTGSGAIAVTLALERPAWRIEGWDVSADALQVARDNAVRLGARALFRRADILDRDHWRVSPAGYDIVVSNPPYVRTSERRTMHVNVLEHEPSGALFVPDDDPLVFYRAIGLFALRNLVSAGRLYFEINRAFGPETVRLLESLGFVRVVLAKDLDGCDRMVRAYKP